MKIELINNWNKTASSSAFVILTICIFLAILALAVIVGTLRGLYGAIYSFGFHVLGFVLGVIFAPLLANWTSGQWIKNNGYLSEFKSLVAGIYMFVIMLIAIIVSEIIYKFVKAFIIRPLKRRQSLGQNTILYRSLGAIVLAVGSIPMAIVSTNLTGFVNYNGHMINANSKMLNAITFGKSKGVNKFTPGLIALAKNYFDDDVRGLPYEFLKSLRNDHAFEIKKENSKITLYFNPYVNQDKSAKKMSDNLEKFKENLRLFNRYDESFSILKAVLEFINDESFSAVLKSKIDQINDEIKKYNIDYSQLDFQIKDQNGYEKFDLAVFDKDQSQELKSLIYQKLGVGDDKYQLNGVPKHYDAQELKYKYFLSKILNKIL